MYEKEIAYIYNVTTDVNYRKEVMCMEFNPKSTLDNLGGKGYNLNLLKDLHNLTFG